MSVLIATRERGFLQGSPIHSYSTAFFREVSHGDLGHRGDELLAWEYATLSLIASFALYRQMLKIGRPSKYQGPVTPASTWQRLTGQEAADNVVDPATKVYR